MPDSFDIELTSRLKINKLGLELVWLAGFFIVIFGISLIPAQSLPPEMAFLYVFFIIPRGFHLILGIAFLVLLFGEWFRGMRKIEPAKLRVFVDKMVIESFSKTWEIPYNKIQKFKGTLNLVHNYRKLTYTILLKDKTKIEVRTSKEIYNELTDYFPNKE